jgi:hypothetical protein
MTDAIASPESANWCRVLLRGSILLCLAGGDTPYTHVSDFPFNTFLVYDGRLGPSLRR